MALRSVKAAILFFASGFVLHASAITQPDAEQLQAYLHKQVDTENSYFIVPILPTENSNRLAHRMLDNLWKDAAYRDNMRNWLTKNQASVMEDLLGEWQKHYHTAFTESLDLLDDDTIKLLWRLHRTNAMATMDRQLCRTRTEAQVADIIRGEADKLIAAQEDKLAVALPRALTREFARQNSPRAGERPDSNFIAKVAIKTFGAVAKEWPEEDKKRIEGRFSYGDNSGTPQELCEAIWVTSNAIYDSKIEKSDAMLSANILRLSVVKSAYKKTLAQADAPGGARQPAVQGFTPGKALIYYPKIFDNKNLNGSSTYKIAIDDKGKVTQVTQIAGSIKPPSLTSVDGTVFSTEAMLLRIVEHYFRSGSFVPKVVDGKPAAYAISLGFTWSWD
ncbi:hypothetical protein H8L32_22945 [Undibacterium sp. CY18W]|uniref:TonB C-terminal domain-containing protein n=1 Tax=Undibacterium hunanense TaxID=2762292 RepID=A0ABR6ZXN6_9BURK|nr:hypothetical protein [Undibacterium hunanense]MBC3920340.1 hypothetical protein [Undibacterium hunanense]